MRVEPLVPDAPPSPPEHDASAFAGALDAAGALLERAESAEDRFAAKRGSLSDAVYERARADVALSVATAAAGRAAQAVQSIFNLQV